MAITTENVYLGKLDTGKAYKKLVDIKEFPDLGKAPSTVDITTLSDHMKTYLNGIVDPGSLEFNCNYDKDDYETLKALEDDPQTKYCVAFGKTGENGIIVFQGDLAVWIKGGGVEASVDMGVSIAPCTELEMSSDATFSIS